ncbi:asparagine synthase-related protein [Nonomuraea sp. NPDC052129]|uniref:asparagine synthase-related protein n=1 Tax=Nonomuraea sp. NPDC052129 TaxID=3154651 RepID=UPI00342F9C04
MLGEMWFAVLPDGEAGLAAAGVLLPGASQVIDHASGRPWLIGDWPGHQIRLAAAGAARVAVIGRCPVTATDLALRLARISDVERIEQVVAGLTGSFHLVASIDGRVAVRGTASAVRRVFHARVRGVTVAASRSDVLAWATGGRIDERVLATRLLPSGVVGPLQDLGVWRDVSCLPPDRTLLIEPTGMTGIRTWWHPPEPALPLAEGATALREALTGAVDACTADGGTISADLSGGIDSTSLCFLAARGRASLITVHCEGMDPGNDDPAWAFRAATGLPDATHHVIGSDELPLWFAGLTEPQPSMEEPSGWVRDAARLADLAWRLSTAGSRLHLMGVGGDELFSALPPYLHDLVRDRPFTAPAHLRARRARWRSSWWRMLRALADRADHPAWLERCVADLSTTPAAADAYSMAWGPPLRMPPWATACAVHAARDVLAGIAAARPAPLSPLRAQHQTLLYARTGGAGLRQIDQATSRLGLPYAAPYLDDAVIEAALSVRPDERAGLGRYKPLLAASMDGVVPAEMLERSTKGEYGADFYAGWRRHRDSVLELFEASELGRLGLIDTGALRAALLGVHPRPHVMEPLSQTLACEIWLRSLTPHRMPAMTTGDS